MKGFSIRAPHNAIFTDRKVDCPEGVCMIFLIRCFLLEHWELHILFHSILFTKNVIVVRTITGICNWIFRIESVDIFEFFHQRYKAVHVAAWSVLE